MVQKIWNTLFPPKCVLCKKLLKENEADLCRNCRENAPEFGSHKIKLSFIAQWTGLWYYKDNVRASLLRYKFARYRSYVPCYGRLLAMKLQNRTDKDILDLFGSLGNRQGYIKRLIRDDLDGEKKYLQYLKKY